MELPTDEQLQEFLNDEDPISFVIRGHQALEAAIISAINEALPMPHELEISRLSFNLKVDLAIALHIVRPEIRPILLAVNAVRNKFAHTPGYQFDNKAALDLKNTICSTGFGFEKHFVSIKEPHEVLRCAIALCFFLGTSALAQVRDKKLESSVVMDMVKETLDKRPRAARTVQLSQTYAEFRRRVVERKVT